MSTQYNKYTRILHWSMALIFIITIIIAFYMDDLPKSEQTQYVLIHRSLGVLLLQLAVIRIIWVVLNAAPAMPKNIPHLEVKVGKIVQHSFYLLMLIQPITGFFLTVTGGQKVSFFGLYELPLLVEKNLDLQETLEDAHSFLGVLLTSLIVLHIAAGLWHRYKNDGVFERMWFTRKKVDFLTAKLTK